jgi:hypothetical protein
LVSFRFLRSTAVTELFSITIIFFTWRVSATCPLIFTSIPFPRTRTIIITPYPQLGVVDGMEVINNMLSPFIRGTVTFIVFTEDTPYLLPTHPTPILAVPGHEIIGCVWGEDS